MLQDLKKFIDSKNCHPKLGKMACVLPVIILLLKRLSGTRGALGGLVVIGALLVIVPFLPLGLWYAWRGMPGRHVCQSGGPMSSFGHFASSLGQDSGTYDQSGTRNVGRNASHAAFWKKTSIISCCL